MTVIYTSHYMEEVEAICQNVYIMDHGKIIASGTQEALIDQSDSHTSIHLKFDDNVKSRIDAFKQINNVMAVSAIEDDEMVILAGGNGNSQKEIIRAIMEMEIGLVSFDVTKPNLEQVFLKLTGRGLRD